MLRVKLSVVYALGLITVAMGLAACSTVPVDKTAGMSPNAIYADAKDSMDSGQYDKAIPLFEKLEARAAGTPLAQQAQLDKAYAQYKTSEPAQAIATLDQWAVRVKQETDRQLYRFRRDPVGYNNSEGYFRMLMLVFQDLAGEGLGRGGSGQGLPAVAVTGRGTGVLHGIA